MPLRKYRIIPLITLPVVMWLFYNQTANWHFHLLENGWVIEHAHPYKNSVPGDTPYQKHHHTDFEYSLLSLISQITAGMWWLFMISLGLHPQISKIGFPVSQVNFLPVFSRSNSLRGPPAVI